MANLSGFTAKTAGLGRSDDLPGILARGLPVQGLSLDPRANQDYPEASGRPTSPRHSLSRTARLGFARVGTLAPGVYPRANLKLKFIITKNCGTWIRTKIT